MIWWLVTGTIFMPVGRTGWRSLIATLGGAFSMSFGFSAAAQEWMHDVDHEWWHQEFYSKLKRNDGPCCSNYDCRPTQSRWVLDHYEVKVESKWTVVPWDIIKPEIAPDGGAHVCASPEGDGCVATLFCVILPPDSWQWNRLIIIALARRRQLTTLGHRRFPLLLSPPGANSTWPAANQEVSFLPNRTLTIWVCPRRVGRLSISEIKPTVPALIASLSNCIPTRKRTLSPIRNSHVTTVTRELDRQQLKRPDVSVGPTTLTAHLRSTAFQGGEEERPASFGESWQGSISRAEDDRAPKLHTKVT